MMTHFVVGLNVEFGGWRRFSHTNVSRIRLSFKFSDDFSKGMLSIVNVSSIFCVICHDVDDHNGVFVISLTHLLKSFIQGKCSVCFNVVAFIGSIQFLELLVDFNDEVWSSIVVGITVHVYWG